MDFALEDKGALGLNLSKDADFVLEKFIDASKARHAELDSASHTKEIPNQVRNDNLLAKQRGFTLAEVLITLGIIGVVAALTIPTLMQKYHKSVIESKLKETASMLQNAYELSEVDYGLNHIREGFEANNPDKAMEMFEKYYIPYIKFIEVKKGEKGVFGLLANGAEIYFRRTDFDGGDNWATTYIIFCENDKVCKEINENATSNTFSNNKNSFLLYTDGCRDGVWAMYNHTRETNLERCAIKEGAESCTALIIENSWHFPDDYPIKF
ncbi:type II secretion system protein [bacterium]|nr:type II secretion system protein [bacterium]